MRKTKQILQLEGFLLRLLWHYINIEVLPAKRLVLTFRFHTIRNSRVEFYLSFIDTFDLEQRFFKWLLKIMYHYSHFFTTYSDANQCVVKT